MPRSHIREIEEEAALFALGALPSQEAGGFRQRVAAGCPLCRAALEDSRNTVAMLPMAAPDAKPSAGLRQRILDRIAPKLPDVGTLVRAGDTPWEQSPIAGVEVRKLHGRKTMLVRMAPGTIYPQHEHAFAEQCLVLEGSIRSGDMMVQAGDFTFMPPGSTHSPLFTETGCVLLLAYT